MRAEWTASTVVHSFTESEAEVKIFFLLFSSFRSEEIYLPHALQQRASAKSEPYWQYVKY